MKLAATNQCTACAACINVCGHKALSLVVNDEGYYEVKKNQSQCIECGLCESVCPILKAPVETELGSKYYACWNTKQDLRNISASGGAFSAIAYRVLSNNGVVYGASLDGFNVVHLRITRVEDLPKILGSKYQPSDLSGVFKQVKSDLNKGQIVLFSGMACQVAGLLSYLKDRNIENLYTIDTICGGISTMLPMMQLQRKGIYKGIKSFRDKNNGWRSKGYKYSLKMFNNDGTISDLGLDNLVLNTFSSKLFKRASCCNCKFTSPYRKSDATIGDFWGDEEFVNQHEKGLSIIAIHTDKIKQLISESPIELKEIAFRKMISSNHNYYWTKYPLVPYFPTRTLALKELKSNSQVQTLKQLDINSFGGLLLRLYLKITEKILRTTYLNSIIKKYELR